MEHSIVILNGNTLTIKINNNETILNMPDLSNLAENLKNIKM